MSNDAKKVVQLADIADVHSGYPFRGAIKQKPEGEAAVIQIKNVDADHGIDWPRVVRTDLVGRRKPDWLKQGDILFTARGNRNAAASVDQLPFKAVSAPHLFVIRLTRQDQALPEFIAWFMNQAEAQRYLSLSATGSYITNIRKKVLEEMLVKLPSIQKQQLIVQLARAARREEQLLEELIENRNQQLRLVAQSLMD